MAGLYNLKSGVSTSNELVNKVNVYSAAGAVTIENQVALITKSDGACALTLGIPTTAQNGTIIQFISTTAQAHTVTAGTIGFNAGNAGADVGTFGGAIADRFSVVAYGGEWYTLTNTNVTFG